MNYLVLKSCVAAGAKRNVGDIVSLGDDEAKSLVAMGRVDVAPAPKPEIKVEADKKPTNRAAKATSSRAKK
jgi:hypothetical protein